MCELLGGDLAGRVWLDWLWALDLGWRKRAALGNTGGADTARLAVRLDDGSLGALGGWDVEGIELTTSGWLSDGLAGWVMRDVVAVDDVVVPVALALLEGGALEAESALPSTGLGSILRKRKLTIVVVPRAEKVDSLAVGGGAEGEVQLDRCHFE